ncbi:MAG: type II toxin-antitoxin system RelE/ParE family toxin [Bacteroidales bacterium]|nr:type II toxin-antitoxin system RelE/ParE family toxin [Bacteroidales bacterium]
MTVRFTPRAASDLTGVVDYLAERSPQGLLNLKRALETTLRLIEQYPHAGRATGIADVRVLPLGRFHYLIYWTLQANEPWIVHIRDGRRRPWRGE